MGIQRVPNLLRWTVLACCLPYPGDPKSAIDCSFLFGISLHPGVTGSAPHWKFRGCRVHSFPSPQELLRPASWLALLSRTFTFELAPTRSPSISVEYDYVDKQSIPTAGLSPASPTALWAAGHRQFPAFRFTDHRTLFPRHPPPSLATIPYHGSHPSGRRAEVGRTQTFPRWRLPATDHLIDKERTGARSRQSAPAISVCSKTEGFPRTKSSVQCHMPPPNR